MRIGLLYLGKGGGISHCTLELARALSPRAETVCYLASQNDMLELFHDLPCKVRVFPLRRGWRSLLHAALTKTEGSGIAEAIEGDAPDIAIDTGSGGWGNVVLRQICEKIPTAAVIHDILPHPGWRHFVETMPDLMCPLSADAVISMSDYSHQHIVRRYPGKEYIKSKHGVILPCDHIDLDRIAAMRHKLLFLGRIDSYKGLDVLVRAYEIARRSRPDLELHIAGRGEIRREVRKRIAGIGIGLTNRYLTDTEIREVVSNHGVIVLPYTSATQSGVAAVALANGLPCIATTVGALPEQVLHRRNGLLVRPNDPEAMAAAMLEIAGSPDLARSMAEEAIRIGTEAYSWERIAQRLVRDIDSFLRCRQSGAPR